MITTRRSSRPSPLGRASILTATAVLIVALALGTPVAASGATFTPDTAASELMRLLNGERTAHGLPALAVDPFLAWVARDGPVPCPYGSGSMAGRAKDMAVNGFFAHTLRLCPTYDIGDAMHAWGYSSYLGETIAMNGGYDFNPFPYRFGCDVYQANCGGANTSAPTTVAIASYQFMTSQGHRDVVLSRSYDRFACGAWQAPNGDDYFACDFAFGPGSQQVPAPALDATAPTMTALSAPSLVTSATAAFTASFSGSDNVGVTAYQMRTKKGTAGTWSATTTQTATSRAFSGLAAGTWYIDVRARDAATNVSAWRQAMVVIPTDDRAWSFSAGTTRRTLSAYVRGTATTTSASGAKMSIGFSGSSFSLLGTTGRYYGKLRVTLDGTSYTVDTGYYKGVRETGNHYRVLLFSRNLANGSHTVAITCLATSGRRTIGIDAAGWRN